MSKVKVGSNEWLKQYAKRIGFKLVFVGSRSKNKKIKDLEQRMDDLESIPTNRYKLIYQFVEEYISDDLDT